MMLKKIAELFFKGKKEVVEDLDQEYIDRFEELSIKRTSIKNMISQLVDDKAKAESLNRKLWNEMREEYNLEDNGYTLTYSTGFIKDGENNIVAEADKEYIDSFRELEESINPTVQMVKMIRTKLHSVNGEISDVWKEVEKEYNLKKDKNYTYDTNLKKVYLKEENKWKQKN